MSTEEKSLAEKCNEVFEREINAGYQVTDKKSFHTLKNKVMKELKIKSGSNMMAKEELEKVLQKRNIAIPKELPKDTTGISATFEKKPMLPTPEPATLPKSDSEITTSPRGTLPKAESDTTEKTNTPFIADPQEKEKQQKIAENSIGGIIQIVFERIGVLEPKQKPKDEKEKLEQSEQLRKDIDDFSNELGGVLYDNGIKLPSFVKYIDLGIKGYKALAQPLLAKGFGSTDEEPQQKTKEELDREEALKNV